MRVSMIAALLVVASMCMQSTAAALCRSGQQPCGHDASTGGADTFCCNTSSTGEVCRILDITKGTATGCVKEKTCPYGISPCGAGSPTDMTLTSTITDRTPNNMCCQSGEYCKIVSGMGGNASYCTPTTQPLTCASKCGHSYYDDSIPDGFCCYNGRACVAQYGGYPDTRTACAYDKTCGAGEEPCGFAVDAGNNSGLDVGRSAATTCCKAGQVCSFKSHFGKAGAIGKCVTPAQYP